MQFQLIRSVDDQVLDSFVFYAVLLVLKFMSSIWLTSYNRIRHRLPANPEDGPVKGHPQLTTCERMIENDIENIIPFFFLGLIFVMTGGPELSVTYCKNIFRLFFFSRCAMSFCHYFHIQPFRSIFFLVAFACNLVMFGTTAMAVGSAATKYI